MMFSVSVCFCFFSASSFYISPPPDSSVASSFSFASGLYTKHLTWGNCTWRGGFGKQDSNSSAGGDLGSKALNLSTCSLISLRKIPTFCMNLFRLFFFWGKKKPVARWGENCGPLCDVWSKRCSQLRVVSLLQRWREGALSSFAGCRDPTVLQNPPFMGGLELVS